MNNLKEELDNLLSDLWHDKTYPAKTSKAILALFESYVKACKPELPASFRFLNDPLANMYDKAVDEYESNLLGGIKQ